MGSVLMPEATMPCPSKAVPIPRGRVPVVDTARVRIHARLAASGPSCTVLGDLMLMFIGAAVDTIWPCNQDFSLWACHGDCASRNFSIGVGQIMPVGHAYTSSTACITSPPTPTSSGHETGTLLAMTTGLTVGETQIAQSLDTKSLAIGLGVGLPLFAIFLCATVFLGCLLRRNSMARHSRDVITPLAEKRSQFVTPVSAGFPTDIQTIQHTHLEPSPRHHSPTSPLRREYAPEQEYQHRSTIQRQPTHALPVGLDIHELGTR